MWYFSSIYLHDRQHFMIYVSLPMTISMITPCVLSAAGPSAGVIEWLSLMDKKWLQLPQCGTCDQPCWLAKARYIFFFFFTSVLQCQYRLQNKLHTCKTGKGNSAPNAMYTTILGKTLCTSSVLMSDTTRIIFICAYEKLHCDFHIIIVWSGILITS